MSLVNVIPIRPSTIVDASSFNDCGVDVDVTYEFSISLHIMLYGTLTQCSRIHFRVIRLFLWSVTLILFFVMSRHLTKFSVFASAIFICFMLPLFALQISTRRRLFSRSCFATIICCIYSILLFLHTLLSFPQYFILCTFALVSFTGSHLFVYVYVRL